jgi:hypothetical protein
MSGACVFLRKGDAYVPCGIFVGAGTVREGNRSIDVAFFHGIDDMREELKNNKMASI